MSQPEKDFNHQVTINSIDQVITINGTPYLLVSKQDHENSMAHQKEVQEDITTLKNSIVKLLTVLGLFDEKTGLPKKEFTTEDELGNQTFGAGPLQVVKVLKDMIMLFMTSSKEEIMSKFSFIKPCMPIIKKYAGK